MKPNHRIIVGLAFIAVCQTAFAVALAEPAEMNANAAEPITNGAQTNAGDAWSARSALQNVRDSDRYEALVRPNRNFRAARVRKECGPSEDAPIHAECDPKLGR